MALDFGDVDNTLYTAAAKGADRIVKIPLDADRPAAPGGGRRLCRGDQAARRQPGAGRRPGPRRTGRRAAALLAAAWACPTWA